MDQVVGNLPHDRSASPAQHRHHTHYHSYDQGSACHHPRDNSTVARHGTAACPAFHH
jgi:hypothetical protein